MDYLLSLCVCVGIVVVTRGGHSDNCDFLLVFVFNLEYHTCVTMPAERPMSKASENRRVSLNFILILIQEYNIEEYIYKNLYVYFID